jgi:hypothetical protein
MPAKTTGVAGDVPVATDPSGPAPAGADMSVATISLPINVQTQVVDRPAFVYDKTADAYT